MLPKDLKILKTLSFYFLPRLWEEQTHTVMAGERPAMGGPQWQVTGSTEHLEAQIAAAQEVWDGLMQVLSCHPGDRLLRKKGVRKKRMWTRGPTLALPGSLQGLLSQPAVNLKEGNL